MALVTSAIKSGVMNDLGSGSNIDLCIINKDGAEYLRNYEYLQTKTYQRVHPVVYPPGTTRESNTQMTTARMLSPLHSLVFPPQLSTFILTYLLPMSLLLPHAPSSDCEGEDRLAQGRKRGRGSGHGHLLRQIPPLRLIQGLGK